MARSLPASSHSGPTLGSVTAAEESMGKRDGQKENQKGPQQHAEGQHGARAHARFLEQIQQPLSHGDDMAVEAGADEPGMERVERMRSDQSRTQDRDGDASSGRNGQRR
jgi:hypothetical protein